MHSCPKKQPLAVVLILIIIIGEVQSNSTTANDVVSDEVETGQAIREMWKDQEKMLKSAMSSMIKKNMPMLLREIYKRNLSPPCLNSLLQLTGALKQTKLWAFQMIDSSGKFPNGFLAGTMTTLGNYEECLRININQPKVKIQGQYCMVDVTPPMPKWRPFMSLHLPVPELANISAPDTVITHMSRFIHNLYIASIKTGLCIPSSCTKDDAGKLIQIVPEMMNITWKFDVSRCETKSTFKFTTAQMAILYVFSTIVFLIAVGTLLDIVLDKKLFERKGFTGNTMQVFRCFSLRVNMKSIANYVSPQKDLSFIHGFMYIIIIWLMSANAFMSINFDTSANIMDAIKMTQNMWYEIMMNRVIPMQSLLFIGAFVTTYKWMKASENDACIWKHIFKTYWRYTPTYMFLIAFLMLSPGWGSGPTWTDHVAATYSNCRKNWWTNLLYINNFVNSDEMCLDNSWFISVAAQMHVLALVVLIPLRRRPTIGLLLNFLVCVASLLTVFVTNMYYNIIPNETMTFSNSRDKFYYATRSYHRLYSHFIFYSAGIFVGYFTATRPNMKIPFRRSLCLWALTGTGAIATVSIVHVWSDGNMPSSYISATYATFSKLFWAAYLSWITIHCATERKGFFYEMASWRPFSFLTRLLFIVFVINPAVVNMVLSFKRSHMYISDFEIYHNLASLIICNYTPAYAFHIGIESPLLQLTNLLKRTCGAKTFDSNIMSQCEGVLTEKLPKIGNGHSKEIRSPEKIVDKSKC